MRRWVAVLSVILAATAAVAAPVRGTANLAPGAMSQLTETPQICRDRNAYLQSTVIPNLRVRISQLQAVLTARLAAHYTCSGDLNSSSDGLGHVQSCGLYRCDPIDGMCRSFARTSDDCAIGHYLADGEAGACSP